MSYHALIFQDFDGNPITGLAPVFTVMKSLQTGGSVTPPDIEEMGDGFYRFEYNPASSYIFVIDGGASITDARLRWVRGTIDVNQSVVATVLDEVLALLRNDMTFERVGNQTFMILKKDGVPFRKWIVTDQKGRSVDWPDSSRLPVNRQRVF